MTKKLFVSAVSKFLLGAVLVFLAYPFLIAGRIRDEEKLLDEELEGYRAYKERVRWRLIPYVW